MYLCVSVFHVTMCSLQLQMQIDMVQERAIGRRDHGMVVTWTYERH
jgi:hypothetical protein